MKTLHIDLATLHIEVATLHTVYTSFIHGLYIVYKAAKSPVSTTNKNVAKDACEMRQKNTVQGRGKKGEDVCKFHFFETSGCSLMRLKGVKNAKD